MRLDTTCVLLKCDRFGRHEIVLKPTLKSPVCCAHYDDLIVKRANVLYKGKPESIEFEVRLQRFNHAILCNWHPTDIPKGRR